MLTQDLFEEYKNDYEVYGRTTSTDRYGNDYSEYTIKGTVNTMWHPVTDDATLARYGEDNIRVLKAVIYDGDIEEFDRVIIDTWWYEVVSVQQYQTHKEVLVKNLTIGAV